MLFFFIFFLKESSKYRPFGASDEGDLFICSVIALLFFSLRGRRCQQDYFGPSGPWTAERAGGGQKQPQRGEGSTAGQSLRGETLERQPKWPVKVRDSAHGKKKKKKKRIVY